VPTTAGRVRIRPETLVRELDRLIAEVAGSVDRAIDRPHPSPESLHQLHREMRRLRHALAIWEDVLPDRQRQMIQPLARRLKRLARMIGRVRDRDVVLALLEGPSLPSPERADAPRVARLRARLRDDARTGRELVRVFLRSERDGHLFEGLRESLELPPRRRLRSDLQRVLDEEQERRHERVRTAHKDARHRPSSTRLHRLRIRVRQLRHLTEVRTRIDGKSLGRIPSTVRRLQRELGRLHDLDVVLAELDPELGGTAWARALRSERRAVRDSVRKAIRTERWPDLPLVAPAPDRPPATARLAS